MSNRDTLRIVTGWMTDLANLTAGTTPLADAKTKIAAMAMVANQDFPLAAFTPASLVECGRQFTFFPAYAALYKALTAWWNENKPAPAALLTGPSGNDLTDQERQILTTFHRLRAEIITEGRLPNVLNWYRQKFPGAHRHLVEHDPDVTAELQREAKADWNDPGKVLASARKVLSSDVRQLELGKMLAALVRRHAPHNVGLLPPEWQPANEA